MYRTPMMPTLLCAVVLLTGCPYGSNAPAPAGAAQPQKTAPADSKVTVSVRQGKIKDYPCSECHRNVTPGLKPPLEGKHKGMKFAHFDGVKTCSVCHEVNDMDKLKLTTGKLTSFDDSASLCGQCHGERMRDWKIGAHGKHVGGWRGQKSRLTCTDCHDPHTPGFAPVQARKGPPFPEKGIPKTHGGH